jgi:hypothetical protein
VASAGNKIVFAGGYPPSSRVDIYDLTTQTCPTAELSVARGLVKSPFIHFFPLNEITIIFIYQKLHVASATEAVAKTLKEKLV